MMKKALLLGGSLALLTTGALAQGYYLPPSYPVSPYYPNQPTPLTPDGTTILNNGGQLTANFAAPPAAIGATTAVPGTSVFTFITANKSISVGTEILHAGFSRVTPANNGSSTIPASVDTYFIDPAAAITTYTPTLPAAPANNQDLFIMCGQTVTNLVLTPNTGQSIRPNTSGQSTVTVTCGPTQNGGVRLRWFNPQSAWVLW